MADPRQNDVLKQIQAAWGEAQAQLGLLRAQVENATAMATAKVQTNILERDLDRAYKELGEAVWAEVSKGRLVMPKNLESVKKALEQVTVRIQAQNASINDLLAEGAEIAKRLQQKMTVAAQSAASKPVAPPTKKR